MNLRVILSGWLLCSGLIYAQPAWEDLSVSARHTERPHAYMVPYARLEAALAQDSLSPRRMSLNGTWDFKLVYHPDQTPKGFYLPDFQGLIWDTLPVPSCWHFYGYGRPTYHNIILPFPCDPPRVAADTNETGLYRRTFTLPPDWKGQSVFLTFGGAESALSVWLNGQFIGYHEDSFSPAEFDITRNLVPGPNLLAVQVIRWSDGSYLEDQDYWRLGGLFREVSLTARPAAYIRDIRTDTDLDSLYEDATLRVRLHLQQADSQHFTGAVRVIMRDPDQQVCWQDTVPVSYTTAGVVTLRQSFSRPHLWSAEIPTLYRLGIELLSADGQPLEALALDIGFREVRISGTDLLINGRRVMFQGVNRHEFDPQTGRVMTQARMEQDIQLMKKYHFNAVRNAHYPNDPRWYTLCDRYGLYVMDEANLEAHHLWQYEGDSPTDDPEWESAIVRRGLNMVCRNYNHPSVVIWSLGNESGDGPNLKIMADSIRQQDQSGRPIHYESYPVNFSLRKAMNVNPIQVARLVSFQLDGPQVSNYDILSSMYPSPAQTAELAEQDSTRPLILCEYAHSMGNSTGNFAEYWALFRHHPRMQGGFIWDWADQGFLQHLPDGTPWYAYGGDFGDSSPDSNFCFNGIMYPDRRPKPAMAEVAFVQQPLAFEPADSAAGTIHLINRYSFLPLAQVSLALEWLGAYEILHRDTLQLPILAPGETLLIKPGWRSSPLPQVLTLRATLPGRDSPLAVGQLVRPGIVVPAQPVPQRTPAPEVQQTADQWWIRGTGWTLELDPGTGDLRQWITPGSSPDTLLLAGPHITLWRAPTDNDMGGNTLVASYATRWRRRGLDSLINRPTTVILDTTDPAQPVIRTEGILQGKGWKARYTRELVVGPGEIRVQYTVTRGDDYPLPRVGTRWHLRASPDTVRWTGRGPQENYPDRQEGALLGQYDMAAPDLYTPYLQPQENGNRGDVSALTIRYGQRPRVQVTGEPVFQFSLLPFTPESLDKARHPHELQRAPYEVLHVDHRMMGVGGDVSWLPSVHPPYLLTDKTWVAQYRIRVVP